MQQLRELGFDDEAAATARLALRDPEGRDRESLEELLNEIASSPDGWLDALAAFAHDPSEEGWQQLMRFVPEDVWYQRLRNTTDVIEERGAGSGARATWLGLAAQAAFARGDRFAVIRYLREASRADEAFLAWASINEIRQEADEALNAELDKVGVPRM